MENQQKKIGIVIDTNIWRSSLLLKSPLGTSLLYHISRINGFIILPEIIEDEVIKHTVEAGTEANKAINKNFGTLETLRGSRTDYELPDESQLELVAKDRFTELEKFIVKVPRTLEQTRGAERRIKEGTQPNKKDNPQFKDSLIWEAILSLLDSYDIHFIAHDKAFFKGYDLKTNRLAKNLQEDCRIKQGKVWIYNKIELCMEVIQKNSPKLSKRELIKMISKELILDYRNQLLSEIGFKVSELSINFSSVFAFLIPNYEELLLSFELQYSLGDTQTNQEEDLRVNARLEVVGECFYEPETSKISEINLQSERAKWLDPTGEANQRGFVYVKASIDLGGGCNQVKYQFKKEIDLED